MQLDRDLDAWRLSELNKDAHYYEQDAIQTGKILFYGDSGFTRWNSRYGNRNLEEEFLLPDGSSSVLNHGIGGSTFEELLYFYPRLVRPYAPRAMVIKSFGNDYGQGYSPEEMIFLFSRLLAYARADMPGIRFYVCDYKPSLKKPKDPVKQKASRDTFNRLLKEYCERHDDCTFVCLSEYPLFYNNPASAGSYTDLREDLFIEDQVHFNQKGYDIYADFFRDVLKDIL